MIGGGPRLAGAVMLALLAVLALELGLDAHTPGDAVDGAEAIPAATVADTDALVPVYSLAEPERFADLAERPLFVATRRPPQPVVEDKVASKPKAKPAKRPEFILSAIVREGNRWIAVVGTRGRGAAPPTEVEVGSVVAGWEVERIGADGVVLRRGTQTAELTLRTY